MARHIQAELEHEADKKGLEGDRRKAYVGGAWARIRWGHAHPDEEQRRHVSRAVGEVEEVRQGRKRGLVAFKQNGEWYELPQAEWRELVRAGREQEREERRADRSRRREERYAKAQERAVRAVGRAEYTDVLNIIKRAGGIRRVRSAATGQERDRGEYETLPRSVRQRRVFGFQTARDRGLTLDEAATEVAQHMPWLKLDTSDDLVQYFERHRDLEAARRYRGGLSLAA